MEITGAWRQRSQDRASIIAVRDAGEPTGARRTISRKAAHWYAVTISTWHTLYRVT